MMPMDYRLWMSNLSSYYELQLYRMSCLIAHVCMKKKQFLEKWYCVMILET